MFCACSKLKLSGIPVLFIPGNAGSHKQGTVISSLPRLQEEGSGNQRLQYSGPSILIKTTHGTKKMWCYVAGGLKIKVIYHRKCPLGPNQVVLQSRMVLK